MAKKNIEKKSSPFEESQHVVDSKVYTYVHSYETGKIDFAENLIPVQKFPEGVYPVNISYSRTKKLIVNGRDDGSIFVSITCPCVFERREECFDFVKGFVSKKISKEIKRIKSLRKRKSK